MRQKTDEKLTKIKQELMDCGKQDLCLIQIKSIIRKYVASSYVNVYIAKLELYGFLSPIKQRKRKK